MISSAEGIKQRVAEHLASRGVGKSDQDHEKEKGQPDQGKDTKSVKAAAESSQATQVNKLIDGLLPAFGALLPGQYDAIAAFVIGMVDKVAWPGAGAPPVPAKPPAPKPDAPPKPPLNTDGIPPGLIPKDVPVHSPEIAGPDQHKPVEPQVGPTFPATTTPHGVVNPALHPDRPQGSAAAIPQGEVATLPASFTPSPPHPDAVPDPDKPHVESHPNPAPVTDKPPGPAPVGRPSPDPAKGSGKK